jgi:type I restriction enzyme S subunit
METKGGYRMVTSALTLKNDYLDATPKVRFVELPKDDVKWCTVSLSDVINANKRLEAAVFDVDSKHARDVIANCKWESVPLYGTEGLIELAYYPGWMQRSRLKRIWCDRQYGEGFYIPSQMMDIYPSPEKYISRLADCDMNELRLRKGTLLLTRSGTIGNVSYVSKTLEGRVFSDDVIRITFKERYDLGYVYTFLKSEVGNLILRTNGYGSVITHIEPEHLAEIHVPNAPVDTREKINNKIVRSFSLRDESNELIDQATALLIHELNLPPTSRFETAQFDNETDLNNYNVKLSQLSGRLDGSYHVPIVSAIEEHLHKHAAEVTTLGDNRISQDIILPGRFKRVYVDEGQGRVFFGGKQIYELDPSNKKFLSISKHSARIKAELEITENTILITRSGTVGKVNIAPKHWEHWIASDHIIRVVPIDSAIAGYLYIFLASDYGRALITRFTYGSVVDEIDAKHVSRIPFPLLKDSAVQEKINRLALEANELRYQAYQLEQDAMQAMDSEVIFAK